MSRDKIRKLFPNGEDGTTIINGTIFVNEGGEPNLSQSVLFAHSLKHLYQYEKEFGSLTKISKQFKTNLYESFLKQEVEALGQYFTPRKLVQSMIRLSGADQEGFRYEGKRFCDPFCGVGGFPLELLNMNDNMMKCYIPNRDGEVGVPFILNGFDKGFEREDERTIILAKANMLIYLADIIFKNPTLTKKFAEQFNQTFHLFKNNLGTFGKIIDAEQDKYDFIFTNPPYVTRGSGIIKEEIEQNAKIKNKYPINARGLEGLSLEWIINNLKKGGRAFVVIPDGVLERKNDKRLRDHILKNCYLDAIISLPVRTFFANFRKTYIIAFTKKINPDDIQTFPVFTYLISNIGEELTKAQRDEIQENDLPELETLFLSYVALRERGNRNIKDLLENFSKRCKIQNINLFTTSDNWRIDNWWSSDEKVELGVEKVKGKTTAKALIAALEDTKKVIDICSKVIEQKDEEVKNYSSKRIEDLFTLAKGNSKYTKRYMKQHKGLFPVYSSKTQDEGIIGYIDSFDYDVESVLTWTTDGIYAGRVFLREGRFSMTTHCGILIPKENTLYLPYVRYILNSLCPQIALGQEGQNKRVTVDIIKNLEIKIPIDDSEVPDLNKQKLLAERFKEIENKKEKLRNIKSKLSELLDDFLYV